MTMGGKDGIGDRSDVSMDMVRCVICCLSFEGTKIGTKDIVGRLDMLLVDGTIAYVVDGHIHEFTTPRSHDDVLYTPCQDSMFVLSFSEVLSAASYGGNHGPESAERLMIL